MDRSDKSYLSRITGHTVVRTGAIYLGGAWLVVQVADVLLEASLAPQWALPATIVAAVLGLPVSLVAAWLYYRNSMQRFVAAGPAAGEAQATDVYICYDASDRKRVFSDTKKLLGNGRRVYLRAPNRRGHDEDVAAARAIATSKVVVFYISGAAIVREHCIHEIEFAAGCGKPIVCVHLDTVEISAALKRVLGHDRRLDAATDDFIERLDLLVQQLGKGESRALLVPGKATAELPDRYEATRPTTEDFFFRQLARDAISGKEVRIALLYAPGQVQALEELKRLASTSRWPPFNPIVDLFRSGDQLAVVSPAIEGPSRLDMASAVKCIKLLIEHVQANHFEGVHLNLSVLSVNDRCEPRFDAVPLDYHASGMCSHERPANYRESFIADAIDWLTGPTWLDEDEPVPVCLRMMATILRGENPCMDLAACERMLATLESYYTGVFRPPAHRLMGNAESIDTGSGVIQRQLIEGGANVLLVCGEPGTGKTALVDYLMETARTLQVRVIKGTAHEVAVLPFEAFIEAFAEDWGKGRQPPSLDQMYSLLASRLFQIASARPLLLVLEDIHWFGTDSLKLLEHLAATWSRGNYRQASLTVVLSFRPMNSRTALFEVVENIKRLGRCRWLPMACFDQFDTAEYIHSITGSRPAAAFAKRMFEMSHGNPLYISELTRFLGDRDVLRSRRGFLTSKVNLDEAGLPDSLSAAFFERIRELSPALQDLLLTASLMGRDIDLAALTAADCGSREHLLNLFADAEAASLIHLDQGKIRFSHALVQQAFHDWMTPIQRQIRHLQLANAYEQLQRSTGDDYTIETGAHYKEAIDIADKDLVVRVCLSAAWRSAEGFAWERARRFCSLVVDQGHGRLCDGELADAYLIRARAEAQLGDVETALVDFRRARLLAETASDEVRRAAALDGLLRGAVISGVGLEDMENIVSDLNRDLDAIPVENTRLRVSIMETLFAAYGTLRRHDEASAIMVRAEREVSGPGMEAARHNLCNARCNARLAKLDVDSAFAIWSEAEQYAAASDNPVLRARCQQRLTIPLLYMGRLDETCDMAKRAIDSSHTIRTTGDLSIALTCATTAALAQGRLREASAMGEQALQLIRETRYANSSVDLVAALACLHCWRGEFATARAVINTLMDPTFIFDNPAPFRHTVERLIELVDSYGGRGPDSPVGVPPVAGRSYSVNRLRRYCMTIDMAAMHNQSQVIAPANHALAVLSEHGIVFSSGWVYLLPRMQGIGAHMTGDHDAAAMHFEQALDVCERAGASAERANTLLDWARLDADQGRHAVAVCKLDQAMASYARFGMMAMHHQAELLRKRLTGTSLTAGNGGEHDDRTYGTGPQ